VKKIPLKPISLVLITITMALAYVLGWSQIFTVKEITVIGSPNSLSEGAVRKISQINVGQQLARVNIQSVESNIERLNWVRDAEVSRDWIDGSVALSVTLREPIAYFNSDQVSGQTIDSEGTLFILPGFTSSDLAVISSSSPDGALEANQLFTDLPKDFRRSISSMVASTPSSFILNTRFKGRNIEIRWGDSSQINLKISVIKRLLAMPENKKVTVIDLLAPHAPIVR
jgi:cell division septal protein FtsQ